METTIIDYVAILILPLVFLVWFLYLMLHDKKKLVAIEETGIGTSIGSSFVQVVPDSQYFTDIDQIINYATLANPIDKDYLLVALKNTKEQGYFLAKKDVVQSIETTHNKFFGENITNAINILKKDDNNN